MSEEQSDSTKELQQGVVPISITNEMKDSFLAYAMSVITARALPDVRDGLKPVHRRILFAMHENGLTAGAKFRKSATVVGDVLGKYHPHGDTAVYFSMVGMAQYFTSRYPLVFGQGNFGSIDGDPPAAYRYTEAKMQKITAELLRDIGKNTVNFRPNFDDTRKEPEVFPNVLPNLLLNGSLGIAVGMATNIPPHNLSEVVDATVHLLDNPESTSKDLMEFVKGPDFPMGGVIFNKKEIAEAYATGRGGIVFRGELEIVENKRGQSQIIISSLPFRANKISLIEKIARLVSEKKIKGIKGLRDESTKDIRIAIDIKAGIVPQRIVNMLYKLTDLESKFNFNMVALVDGVPQTLSLREILTHFVAHRQEVVRRRTEYDLAKAKARAHILEGLKKALDNIDEVIQIIKKSADTPTAKANLIKKFKFSDIQAQAILDMRLQKLAGLERKKIEDELAAILKLIAELESLLASKAKMLKVIKDELLEAKDTYGDQRRTRVMAHGVKNITDADLVPDREYALVMTSGGYIKRTDPDEFKRQRRGGVGVVDMNTKEEDVVTHLITGNARHDILFFTDQGKVYSTKMYEIPEARRATRGKAIVNFLQLSSDERVTSILMVPKDIKDSDLHLICVTKQGVIKKMAANSFEKVRASGLIAINLRDGDELLSARFVQEKDTVVLATQNGQSIRFASGDVRAMGRTAGGVKAIDLKKDDIVVGVGIAQAGTTDAQVLIVTTEGYGKMTDIGEYKIQNRGGSGIKTANLTEKTGHIAGARVVTTEDLELIAISAKSQVIKIALEDIPNLGRSTQGVRIMRLKGGDNVVSLAVV